jgi:hypothetical protein
LHLLRTIMALGDPALRFTLEVESPSLFNCQMWKP